MASRSCITKNCLVFSCPQLVSQTSSTSVSTPTILAGFILCFRKVKDSFGQGSGDPPYTGVWNLFKNKQWDLEPNECIPANWSCMTNGFEECNLKAVRTQPAHWWCVELGTSQLAAISYKKGSSQSQPSSENYQFSLTTGSPAPFAVF